LRSCRLEHCLDYRNLKRKLLQLIVACFDQWEFLLLLEEEETVDLQLLYLNSGLNFPKENRLNLVKELTTTNF